MAVPIVVLALLGYERLALLAATGAFTVIYGGWLRPRERARFAPLVSLALFACAAAGTLAAGGGVVAVLVGVLMLTVTARRRKRNGDLAHRASPPYTGYAYTQK